MSRSGTRQHTPFSRKRLRDRAYGLERRPRNHLHATAAQVISDFAQYGSRIPLFDDISYEDVYQAATRQRDAEDFA